MRDAMSSSENDVSSGEGPNAKRRRRDPDAKPKKGVVVLLDSDVSVSVNGQVRMPNTIEMAKLKKPEKGQYCRIYFTSEMSKREVLSTLHSNFSIIRNKRLGCASATNGLLDFHGGKRIWNGAEIKKFAKGHSALYLFAEENHESEDSQVLTGASQESLKPVSMASCSKQRELIAQTSEQGSSLQQAPAVAAAHTNVPAKVFFSQTPSAKKLPLSARKQKSHPHGHQEFSVLMAVSEGETTESGIDSLLENESNHDTVQSRVLAATQRLQALSQLHASSNQRHLTGTWNTCGAFVSNANHELLQRGREDSTTQPDHTVGSKQGLSVVQKRPNDPIVQTTVDPVAQESLNSVSMTSHNKQSELIAQTSEQGSYLQHTPPAAAATHKNVPTKVLSSPTTSRKKLPVSERKSRPPGNQEFPVLMAMSQGKTTESGIDSLLESESNHDTVQRRDIVHEISPSKGSIKGGDKFHMILREFHPFEIDSFVAVFQFHEAVQVHLEQTNLETLTGITPTMELIKLGGLKSMERLSLWT